MKKKLIIPVLLVSLLAIGGTYLGTRIAASAADATPCSVMTADIFHQVNPSKPTTLLTPWNSEVTSAQTKYGFTESHGKAFKAATRPSAGLTPVHRLYNTRSKDFVWISEHNGAELAKAKSTYGYTDQGVNFYATATPLSCSVPVYRYLKGSYHQYAVTAAERNALANAGWKPEGISFYGASAGVLAKPITVPKPAPSTVTPAPIKPSTTPVKPPAPAPAPAPKPVPAPVAGDADGTFSFAVLPDTQNETYSGNTQFMDRAKWIAANKNSRDIRFVTSSGDVHNWPHVDRKQLAITSAGMSVIEQAGIPYTLAIGNHDTAAVCNGGSACPGANTSATVRNTSAFNSTYNSSRYRNVAGAYEAGKVDNIYATYSAGGTQWMVLVLELWPRTDVIKWAKNVVASHPRHNVIVVTHSYLNSDGSIGGSNGGYGATSPRYLFDQLIKVYPNIKMVFSGHVGSFASRVDTGVNGNTIVSYLECFHAAGATPTRMVTVNVPANTVTSSVLNTRTGTTYGGSATTHTNMRFVK